MLIYSSSASLKIAFSSVFIFSSLVSRGFLLGLKYLLKRECLRGMNGLLSLWPLIPAHVEPQLQPSPTWEGPCALVLSSDGQRCSLHIAFQSEILLPVMWIGFPNFISLLSTSIKSPLAHKDKVTVPWCSTSMCRCCLSPRLPGCSSPVGTFP